MGVSVYTLHDLSVHAGTPNPDGEGIALVINPKSGSGRAAKILPAVHEAFPRMRIVELGRDGEDYGQVIRETAASCEVLAVAGGDGTVQQAAAAAMHHGIPLAVFPAGTFNHFAKDLGMFPLKAAIDAIHAGTYAKVDLGEANGTIFVNTASIGAYTDFVAIREKYERRISKPSRLVFFRVAGDGAGLRDRRDQTFIAHIAGAGAALLLAEVHGDADTTILIGFDRLDFTHSHADVQPPRLRAADLGLGCALLAGELK